MLIILVQKESGESFIIKRKSNRRKVWKSFVYKFAVYPAVCEDDEAESVLSGKRAAF